MTDSIPTENSPKRALRPDIQGLRAIAVVVVILDHLLQWPSGGFVGVDIFFVISGFLITGILLREYDKTEHISFLGFYARRIRRIIPAATLVLIVTSAAAFFLLAPGRFWATLGDAFWAFVFLGNWHMAIAGTDYFQLGLPPSPVQHYWSLSVEEQFYFVWPWLMLALLVLAARIGWSVAARRRLVIGTLVVLSLASFAWAMYESSANPTFAYFSTFSRAWELGIGALLAALVPLLNRIPGAVRPILGWLGLFGILASVFFITSDLPFPAPWAAAPVFSAGLMLIAGTGASGPRYSRALFPLTNPVSRYIGDISYSMYLWHFPLIVLLLALLPASSPIYVLACLGGTLALSVISYHFIENAFREKQSTSRRRRRRRRRRSGSRPSKVSIAGLVALIIATAVLVPLALARTTVVTTPVGVTTPKVSASATAPNCIGADFTDAAKGPTCDVAALGSQLLPTVDRLTADTANAYNCYKGAGKPLETCNYGVKSANALRVAIVGDSHAAMLIPALTPALESLNWSLDTYVGNACQWKMPLSSNCSGVMTQIREIFASKHYDVIIAAGARWLGGDPQTAAVAYATAWKEAIARGTRVIAVADAPATTQEAIACVARIGFNPVDNDCGTAHDAAFAQKDPIIAAQLAGASLVDMSDHYCTKTFCPSVIGHVQVYRDAASHVSATWMKSLAPYLLARVQAALAE